MSVSIVAASVLVFIVPWTVRNYQQLKKPVFATTHGGYTLLLANNPHFYSFLRDPQGRTVWDANELHATMQAAQPERMRDFPGQHWEVVQDRLCYAEAWQTIRRQPVDFAYSCVVRVGRLWRPMPHRLTTDETRARCALRYTIGGWHGLLLVLAAVGAYQRLRTLARSPLLGGVLFCLSITLVHALFWSNIRMRAPAMPIICCFAVIGVTGLLSYMRRWPGMQKVLGANVSARLM